jgi:hypothetical protein
VRFIVEVYAPKLSGYSLKPERLSKSSIIKFFDSHFGFKEQPYETLQCYEHHVPSAVIPCHQTRPRSEDADRGIDDCRLSWISQNRNAENAYGKETGNNMAVISFASESFGFKSVYSSIERWVLIFSQLHRDILRKRRFVAGGPS